ncbi:hypothetical protein LINPERPRIM_LOCUS2775 [Linum perenne]
MKKLQRVFQDLRAILLLVFGHQETGRDTLRKRESSPWCFVLCISYGCYWMLSLWMLMISDTVFDL